jgi:hypothetical protein
MAKNTAKISYGPGFGPEDDLFGEKGLQTNNPNATPVGQRGLDPSLRRIVEQNMGLRRRTMGGQLEDPLAPTGIDWLRDNGGRGQTNSWNQPQYPSVNQSGADRRALADILDAGSRQTVYDGRGTTIRSQYGTGTNVPMARDIPEEGTQRLPNAESAALAASLSSIFNEQASTPRPMIPDSLSTNFDLTTPQAVPPSTEGQNLPSFNPNDSLWQRFQRGEMNPPQKVDPIQWLGPEATPLGNLPTASPMPVAANIPTAQPTGLDPQTQEAVNYFTRRPEESQLFEQLKRLYMMFVPKV